MYGNGRIRQLACLLAVLLAVFSGCSRPGRQNPVPPSSESVQEVPRSGRTFSMATNGDWSSSFKGKIMEKELQELEARTDGAVKIRLYDRSRLGDDVHLMSGVMAGTIDILQSSPASQIGVVPEAAFLNVPGLFTTLEEWNELLSGAFLETMKKYYEDAGLKLLDVFAYSWRELSSQVPVRTPEDLVDIRIRTMEDPYQEAFWSSLGAVPVPYDYAELYFCIHEGMADAQENLLDVMLLDNLHELQSCVTFTHHLPMLHAIAMRRELYESLTEEEQEALAQFTEGLKKNLISRMPEEEERLAETLDHDYGLEMLEPSGELLEKIREGSAVVLGMLEENLGKPKTEAFLQVVEEIRNRHSRAENRADKENTESE